MASMAAAIVSQRVVGQIVWLVLGLGKLINLLKFRFDH